MFCLKGHSLKSRDCVGFSYVNVCMTSFCLKVTRGDSEISGNSLYVNACEFSFEMTFARKFWPTPCRPLYVYSFTLTYVIMIVRPL